ncbi:citrate synthase family protein [Kallotenue papyrolyticum]|uniref:citrate synthase family protein n=1 Tax=Kallotenue papyrolyticum TaxID=1325125 RepID=UPI000492E69F|nr:citrate synthase family protein [Kallotenue papyrolyticum]
MTRSSYLSAAEAARELGVSLPTLYAYVSRGLIRSLPGAGPSRARRYSAEDVRRLRERKAARRDPERAAATALRWGAPVLESALTLIADGRLYYRGQDATLLAVQHSFEEVVALLWTGDMAHALRAALRGPYRLPPRCRAVWEQVRDLQPAERMAVALALAAPDDLPAWDARPVAQLQTATRIMGLLLAAALDELEAPLTPAQALAQRWAPTVPAAERLLTAALILCADHELNVSSFTARCVASAGASLYGALQAGLAALQGVRHGGHTERVAALLREIGAPAQAPAVVAARLRRGEAVPGFGHVLYPQGDPRAATLLQLIQQHLAESPAWALSAALVAAVAEITGEQPTIDLALVTLAETLALPPGAPLALFALGRAAGWLAHALEQATQAALIRPRARYSGPLPDAPPAETVVDKIDKPT